MKRLITITILGLALSFPSLSFAIDYMSLYTRPIGKSDVKNDTKEGNLEKDFMSFYTSPSFKTNPKLANPPTLLTSDQKSEVEYISVFSVQIPRRSS
jgi:hypothetical protein